MVGILSRMLDSLKWLRGELNKKNWQKSMKQRTKNEYSEKEYWEGKVPDDKFDEYLNKYGYEYTPTDYDKIPSRY